LKTFVTETNPPSVCVKQTSAEVSVRKSTERVKQLSADN